MKSTKVSKKSATKSGKKSNRGRHVTSPLLPADLLAALPNFKPAPDKPPGPAMAFLANVPDGVGFAGPRRIDWRLGGAVPVPGSQGGLNTCTSFAVVSVVEALHFLRHHTRIKLSPGFIHTCLLGLPPELGANPQDAIDASAAHGIAFGFPGDYPYPTDHCTTGNLYAISRRAWLPGRNAVLQVLATQGPVVADMNIDGAFYHVGPGQVYTVGPGPQWLHTVSIVGYDLDAANWIVANCMGTGWGDAGFGRVAFGSGGLVDERGAWQVVL